MTAEIVVMNKIATALAADSAATILLPNHSPKVYGANKLFRLAHNLPVGVLVYGTAEFMGIPWEVLIKEFRSTVTGHQQKHLQDYATDFTTFLATQKWIHDDGESEAAAQVSMVSALQLLDLPAIKQRSEDWQKTKPPEKWDDGIQVIRESVKNALAWGATYVGAKTSEVEKFETLDGIDEESRKRIEQSFTKSAELISGRLAGRVLPFPLPQINELEEMVQFKAAVTKFLLKSLTRQLPGELTSGIVFSGFGTDDNFPATVAMSFQGVLCGKVLCKKDKTRSVLIDRQNPAAVIGFAQSDMIDTFMHGADPQLKREWWDLFEAFLTRLPEWLVKGGVEGENATKAASGFIENTRKEFFKTAEKRQFDLHSRDLNLAVEYLAKDEMADLAESLIRLTSLKRRVTMSAETVGGPVDVAVISRREGFVYVKRKHYFPLELNPHYVRTTEDRTNG